MARAVKKTDAAKAPAKNVVSSSLELLVTIVNRNKADFYMDLIQSFEVNMQLKYREAQDDYLEFLAQTLSEGKYLPKNIIEEYKPYYKGTAKPWQEGLNGFWNEFKRFINI